MPRLKLFRWRAIVPLGLFLVLLVVAWILLFDLLVERGIEQVGTVLVGARVDLADADVRLGEGVVRLRGLQVTNPDAPMTNLVQADEIVTDLRMAPLLRKKIWIDTVAFRGIRFNTPRKTSGALDEPPPGSGRLQREIAQWAAGVRVPPLSVEGLKQVVNVDAVQPESLRTIAAAQAAASYADSLGGRWQQQLAALDPQPRIDSTRALIQRLRTADPGKLGVSGVTSLANSARTTLGAVQSLHRGVTALDSLARGDVGQARTRLGALADARAADYAYARGLLKLPSLEGPDISPAIFGDMALAYLKPVLYWVRVVEEYLPPGLDPRRQVGPTRQRDPGTTVRFPTRTSYPRFLLEHGDASLELGGSGASAGQYAARIEGLTSDPALYGKPLVLSAARLAAAQGPRDIRVFGLFDHLGAPLRDSVEALLRGVALPAFAVGPLGARLVMGEGTTSLSLRRVGDEIGARWTFRTANAVWERLDGAGAVAPDSTAAVGTGAWLESLMWRAVSGLRDVEIEVRLAGDVRQPSLGVRSNVGDVVGAALRRELGREIARAEADVRGRVDALVGDQTARAQASVSALEERLTQEIAPRRAELERLEAELQQEIRRLTRRLPGGIRIP